MRILNDEKCRHKKIANFSEGKILDIGFAQEPNKYLQGDVTGFDLNKPTLPSENYKRIVQGDATKLNEYFKEEKFDTILALEFLEHIEGHVTFFRECNKILNVGGKLIISTPFPYFYKAIIGNIFCRKSGNINPHISSYRPTLLNGVAKMTGFKVNKVVAASRIYIPFLTWQMIYVYEKVSPCIKSANNEVEE